MEKSKTKTLILLSLLIVFLFSCVSNEFSKNVLSNNDYIEFNERNQVQINQSGIWNLTGSPIFIDDSDPSNNWAYTALNYVWCSGSGSWTDPYVIENVTIDGQGSDYCIEIWNSVVYFIIRNCYLYNSSYYYDNSSHYYDNANIILSYVNNGKIVNNNCSDYNLYGIYLFRSNNNNISGNTANNHYAGIHLLESNNNNISGNTVNDNSIGIYLLFCSNDNTLSGNIINNNFHGICLVYSRNNALLGNIMNYCGIYLHGILIELASHSIGKANLVNNKPVYYYVNGFGLDSNDFTNAGQIILINCSNSIISGFNLSNGATGIYLGYSDSNMLSRNTVNHNPIGIYLYRSNDNALSENTANNNFYGIYLDVYCDNNTLSGNTANNNCYGICLWYSKDNTLSGNMANNNRYGIYLWDSDSNNLSENTVKNNSYGLYLDSNCKCNYNKIVLNRFINNEVNAEDNGINNTWDDGFTGNYWDDYPGVDANDDGIGDTPYIISGTAGSQDNFPIWTIGDDIVPVITIIFPLPDGVFGLDAPNYQTTISELRLDKVWYTLDGGGTNYTITGLTGSFNQLAWDVLIEDSLTIKFYAKYTSGNIGFATVTVEKDVSAPVITIDFPLPDSVFDLVAPYYHISVDELNLDTIWYSLNGGSNVTFTGLTGTINQALWNALPEGNVTIRFYANDTAGNIGFIEVEVIIEITEDLDELPIISFGNYYILFTFITITILSFIILEKRKQK